jgi:hypothetical protein
MIIHLVIYVDAGYESSVIGGFTEEGQAARLAEAMDAYVQPVVVDSIILPTGEFSVNTPWSYSIDNAGTTEITFGPAPAPPPSKQTRAILNYFGLDDDSPLFDE